MNLILVDSQLMIFMDSSAATCLRGPTYLVLLIPNTLNTSDFLIHPA